MLFRSVAPVEKGRAANVCDAGTGEPHPHGKNSMPQKWNFRADVYFRALGISPSLRNL